MSPFSKICGEILRNARRERGLTLRDVMRLSRGSFKPSSIGGYERGERSITLERFCALSTLYERPPDRLLGEVLMGLQPKSHGEIIIDLNQLSSIAGEEALALAEFIHNIRTQREDYLSDVITLRSGDVEALALSSHSNPKRILQKLRPAVQPPQRHA